jgi:uncharacterized protein (TIGR00730 family)
MSKPSPPMTNESELREAVGAFLLESNFASQDPRTRRLVINLVSEALQLSVEHGVVADLKLVGAAVAEIREALTAFRPYPQDKKVTVFGSARTPRDHPTYQMAVKLGEELAARGFMVITGAGPGIMQAAHEGAGTEKSFGVGIRLPFEQATNSTMADNPKMVQFRYFFTRKLFFLKEAEAVVVFPGGFGSLDEAFETLTLVQTGKAQMMPIILIDEPGGTYWQAWEAFIENSVVSGGYIGAFDRQLYRVTDNIDAALEEIASFYGIYRSARTIRRQLIFRLSRPASSATLATLSKEFSDILGGQSIQPCKPFKEESDQPALAELPRIRLTFDQRSHGQLRRLIDRLNELEA